MDIVLVDKRIRHFNQRDFTSEATIIPPVRFLRWHVIFAPRVVNGRHDKVRPPLERRRHIAMMSGNLPRQHEETRAYVPSAGIQHRARTTSVLHRTEAIRAGCSSLREPSVWGPC